MYALKQPITDLQLVVDNTAATTEPAAKIPTWTQPSDNPYYSDAIAAFTHQAGQPLIDTEICFVDELATIPTVTHAGILTTVTVTFQKRVSTEDFHEVTVNLTTYDHPELGITPGVENFRFAVCPVGWEYHIEHSQPQVISLVDDIPF